MSTPEAMKKRVRLRAGHRCQFCNCSTEENGRALDVHHRTYENQGTEAEEGDLIALCRWCHRSAEAAYERRMMDRYGDGEDIRPWEMSIGDNEERWRDRMSRS